MMNCWSGAVGQEPEGIEKSVNPSQHPARLLFPILRYHLDLVIRAKDLRPLLWQRFIFTTVLYCGVDQESIVYIDEKVMHMEILLFNVKLCVFRSLVAMVAVLYLLSFFCTIVKQDWLFIDKVAYQVGIGRGGQNVGPQRVWNIGMEESLSSATIQQRQVLQSWDLARNLGPKGETFQCLIFGLQNSAKVLHTGRIVHIGGKRQVLERRVLPQSSG